MTTDQLPDLIDRLGEAALDCRAAVREAHEAMADMRRVMKEAKAISYELTEGAISDRIGTAVQKSLGELGEECKAQMDRSVAHIDREFAKLANTYGVGPKNHELADAIRKVQRRGGVRG